MFASSFTDNAFFSGAPFLVPSGGLPQNIKSVTWRANVAVSSAGVKVAWRWGASVYSTFSSALNALGVKPLHSGNLDAYPNGDPAGTPENYKQSLVPGGTGGGGNNYTGGASPQVTC
jgi:hypothetical protein